MQTATAHSIKEITRRQRIHHVSTQHPIDQTHKTHKSPALKAPALATLDQQAMLGLADLQTSRQPLHNSVVHQRPPRIRPAMLSGVLRTTWVGPASPCTWVRSLRRAATSRILVACARTCATCSAAPGEAVAVPAASCPGPACMHHCHCCN